MRLKTEAKISLAFDSKGLGARPMVINARLSHLSGHRGWKIWSCHQNIVLMPTMTTKTDKTSRSRAQKVLTCEYGGGLYVDCSSKSVANTRLHQIFVGHCGSSKSSRPTHNTNRFWHTDPFNRRHFQHTAPNYLVWKDARISLPQIQYVRRYWKENHHGRSVLHVKSWCEKRFLSWLIGVHWG